MTGAGRLWWRLWVSLIFLAVGLISWTHIFMTSLAEYGLIVFVWLVLAISSAGLFAWAAVFTVAAYSRPIRDSSDLEQRLGRLARGVLALVLALFVSSIVAAPTAVVARTFPEFDSAPLQAAFFWSLPASQAVLQVLAFAVDALVMSICIESFGMTLMSTIAVRTNGYNSYSQLLVHRKPKPLEMWLRWIPRFILAVGVHAVIGRDGLLVSILTVGLSAVSFGVMVWLELSLWREMAMRVSNLAKGGPSRLGTVHGKRRTVLTVATVIVAGTTAPWAFLAILYEDQVGTSIGVTSSVGMMLVAFVFSVIRTMGEWVSMRSETVLFYGRSDTDDYRREER